MTLGNVYAPNVESDQVAFIKKKLDEHCNGWRLECSQGY